MNATLVQPFPSWFTLPTKVFASTLPEKVTLCPARPPVTSTYMLASIVLFPTAPGPPLGVYQNGSGSLTLFGPSVRTPGEKTAVRSDVPQELPNTYPPP